MFQKTIAELEELGAQITTHEIQQQPDLWQELWDSYVEQDWHLRFSERMNQIWLMI